MPEQQPNLLELEKRELTTDELWQAMQAASEALEAEQLAALDDAEWIREQRYRVERRETNHTMNVFAAKVDPEDPDSKPLFTNESSRKAEVSRRLSNDPAYKELMAALLVAEKNQAVRNIHIEKLGRDYSSSKLRYEALLIGKRYQ